MQISREGLTPLGAIIIVIIEFTSPATYVTCYQSIIVAIAARLIRSLAIAFANRAPNLLHPPAFWTSAHLLFLL